MPALVSLLILIASAAEAHGTLPGQMDVSGFKGKGLVNSFHQGDVTTGTLTSPLRLSAS